jgi:hypothetical protein
VIDHATARRTFATSLDAPIEPGERDALDAHLHACPECRAFAAALRSDAAALREIDLGPVPIAVRANVAIAAERSGRGGIIGRWVVIAAVGALLLVAVGGGALGIGGKGPASRGDPGSAAPTTGTRLQIAWKTEVVALSATDFSIVAGGKTFRAATSTVEVHSDPGNATYRTLEATWQEQGVEMRLNVYFGGDASSWWVDEIRTYNGAPDGQWLYARGTFFKTAIGSTWTGDQDIAMTDPDRVGGLPARIHFAGLTIASRASEDVLRPVGGPIGSNPFAVGQPLHCSGILQMDPAQAEATLLKMGYPVAWRHLIRNGSYAEALKVPPGRTVIVDDGPFVGSSGQLLISVVDIGDPAAVPVPFPADCPVANPDASPPPPAP